jgi:hypothetical protein
MSGVVMFLNESILDSLKGTYRLRKAYQILYGLFDMIVDVDGMPTDPHSTHIEEDTTKVATPEEISDADSDLFVDASNDLASAANPIALPEALEKMEILNGTTRSEPIPEPVDMLTPRPNSSGAAEALTMSSSRATQELERHPSTATVSSFLQIPTPPLSDLTLTDNTVYTGTFLALGAIMLVISLLPSSLSRLLSIIGFRGSRAQALSLLWKTTAHENPFGGLATFFLAAYYGTVVQNADIVPDEFLTKKKGAGRTIDKLYVAVARARRRYPNAALWAVEEARIESIRGNLEDVVQRLGNIHLDTQMTQIKAYIIFENGLYSPPSTHFFLSPLYILSRQWG